MIKAVSLISGGIDSPVAAKLLIEKGASVVFLHGGRGVHNPKVERLVSIISPKSKLFYVNHNELLKKITSVCDERYTCLLCKRALYRCAEHLAKREGADFIITGESIGQVASQTLANLTVLDEAVKIPVLRPLVGLNKSDIVNLAEEIGTFATSIKDSCTCPFVPKQPSTKAKIDAVRREEEKLELKLDNYFYL